MAIVVYAGAAMNMASRGFSTFDGAVAVVTGGSSGIGRGIAEALIGKGARVIIASRDLPKAERVANEIGATAMEVDVRDFTSVLGLKRRVMDRFGKVNIICNNAGVGPAGKLLSLSLSDWQWMLGVNLWGVINGTLAFLPAIVDNTEGGHVVNTASLAGLWPVDGLGSYGVAKAGVIALSESLHAELGESGKPVGVSVLCPGPVRSEMHTSLRGKEPDAQSGLADLDIRNIFPPELFLEPAECGRLVVDAIASNQLYIITHPQLSRSWNLRKKQIDAAFDHAAIANAPKKDDSDNR